MNEKIRKVKRTAKQIQFNMIAKQLKTTENTQNPQKSQQIVAFILWKSHWTHATRATRATHAKHAKHAFFCHFCNCKTRFLKKNAFFNEPSLSISDSFSTSRTTTSTHWKLQQFFKLPHVDQDLKKCLKQKNRGLPGSLLRKFSWVWWKHARIVLHFLRVSNS